MLRLQLLSSGLSLLSSLCCGLLWPRGYDLRGGLGRCWLRRLLGLLRQDLLGGRLRLVGLRGRLGGCNELCEIVACLGLLLRC